jgi:hypothetical protein
MYFENKYKKMKSQDKKKSISQIPTTPDGNNKQVIMVYIIIKYMCSIRGLA